MSADIQINNNSFGNSNDLSNTLVIEISKSTINVCELNNTNNSIVYSSAYTFEDSDSTSTNDVFLNAVKHYQFGKKNFEKVFINYHTALFTLCPSSFYIKENLRTILEFNVGSTGQQFIETDDINSDIKLIYAVDEQLKSTLNTLFPNHHLQNSVSILSKLMLQSEELNKENILLSVYQNHIEVVVKDGHKLLLANQYNSKNQEDILYYVLFILEQYQLNPLFVNLSICGNIDSNNSLIQSLKKYIKNVRLLTGHKSIDWSRVSGMPQHFNFTLINRLFCE